MGVVIDSSVLIAAERAKLPISLLLESLAADHDAQCILSSITVMELEHGWYRARNSQIAVTRRAYLDEAFAIIPIAPVTREIGALAAKIDAETRIRGRVIATADLLIGATAMHHSYSVGTSNLRHFQMIPGLSVISL